jgi:hypothetical protein
MRCQKNEPDKNEPDNKKVIGQAVMEYIEKGPAEEQNAKTEQKDPDIAFHTVTFLSPELVTDIVSQIIRKFYTGSWP